MFTTAFLNFDLIYYVFNLQLLVSPDHTSNSLNSCPSLLPILNFVDRDREIEERKNDIISWS